MITVSLFRYSAYLITALSLCLLCIVSPAALIAEPKVSRGFCNKDTLVLSGKKYVVNDDGSLSDWDSVQNKPCEEKKPIPLVCGNSIGNSHQIREKRKVIKLLEDGSAPKGFQIFSVNVSCPESTFDSLVDGSVVDIAWHTTSKGKDIKAVIANGTIVSNDETLECQSHSSTLKFILSDKNVLKVKLASSTGKLSILPVE